MQPKSKILFRLLSPALMLVSAHANAAWGKYMPFGINDFSLEAHSPQMVVTIICALIGVVVYAVLIWSLVKYPRPNGSNAAPFHQNTAIEIIWSIIPILILVAIVIPSIYGIT
jgi:cytochrome c oxidase subunit II